MGLREWRHAAFLTQAALAERSGVAKLTIIKIETGQVRSPHPLTLRKLAAALNVSTAALAEHDNDSCGFVYGAHAEGGASR